MARWNNNNNYEVVEGDGNDKRGQTLLGVYNNEYGERTLYDYNLYGDKMDGASEIGHGDCTWVREDSVNAFNHDSDVVEVKKKGWW